MEETNNDIQCLCPECGQACRKKFIAGCPPGFTTVPEPRMAEVTKIFEVPFLCSSCGSIHLPSPRFLRLTVAIWPRPVRERKVGSIILPNEDDYYGGSTFMRTNEFFGAVISTGPGVYSRKDASLHPIEVKVGDIVRYPSPKILPKGWANFPITYKDQDYTILICSEVDLYYKQLLEGFDGQ